MERIVISVPSEEVRMGWTNLASTGFSEEQVMEIVNRYCDQMDLRKSYMKRRNLKNKLLKARVEQLAASSKMTVEEYLELEEANAQEANG